MFRVSPETATSAATFNARSRQARPDPSQSDGFSALVDSNAPDNQRDATPSPDTQPQRLDGGDTPPKADNRPDTRAGDHGRDNSKTSQNSLTADANPEPSTGTGVNANAKSAVKATANSDAKTSAKTDAKTDAKIDAKADQGSADASIAVAATSAEQAAAEAIAAQSKVDTSAHAKVVAASGTAAEATDAKSSADGKAKDADVTNTSMPFGPNALADAAAIVAIAVPVAVAGDGQVATPAAKSDVQIVGTQTASNQFTTTAAATTIAAAVGASADTKEATTPDTKISPAVPTPSSADVSAAADTAVVAVDADTASSKQDAATTAEANTQIKSTAEAEVAAPALDIVASENAATQPVVAKPKASSVAANADTSATTNVDLKVDTLSTSSLPGQTAEPKVPRGAEHPKGASDEQASTADKSSPQSSDAKQANAPAAPPAQHGEHRVPTVAHAAPADLNLQPVQTQQIQQPQAQPQNLTVTSAVQINSTLANTPVPVSGLAVDIALRAAGGSSRFDIRLDPAELGRIDVRLDVDKHGNVTSHLTVEKPATLDMLRQDAPKLQQALEDAGLKTGNGGLQFSLRDQSSGRQDDNGSGRNAQRLIIGEDDTVPAQVAGRTYGRALGSSSGVDIRV